MGTQPAAPWRRLVPLAGVVLAAHLALLQWSPPRWVRPATAVFTVVSPSPVAGAGRGEGHADPPYPEHLQEPMPAPAPVHRAAPKAPRPAPPLPPLPDPGPPALAEAPQLPPPDTTALAAAPAALTETALAAPAPGAPTPPVVVPPSMRLHYAIDVRTHSIALSGSAELDWRQDGHAYEARLEMRSFGLPTRVQRSTGAVTPQGLAPAYFSDKARNELAVHFDREHGRLVFSNNRPDAPIVPGMQDRLSVVLQLAALLAGDPARYPPGTQVTVPTTSAREAEDWVFLVASVEPVDLPGGPRPAVKLQRLPRKPYDQQVELWLAAGADYAPLRLRLTNPNGDAADLRWSSTDRP